MRATSFAGVALAILSLSACGRSVSDIDRAPGRQVLSVPGGGASSLPQKSPGQARLSALRERSKDAPSGFGERSPVATFSQYDGRAPSAASVPRDVAEAEPKLASLLPRPVSSAENQPDAPGPALGEPKRDIVDLGLGSGRPDVSSPPTPPPEVAREVDVALARAPAPVPRPVLQTPKPMSRPTVAGALSTVPQVAAAPVASLPPRPSIVTSTAPSLAGPTGLRDLTPTGLPRFGQSPPQGAGIPLGTIPASLGAANIRSAEAAQPLGDELERSSADDSGAIGWDEAAALIRAGEVETFVDIGEFEVLLTLCSGRGVISIQPTPNAISDVSPPKVVCGKAASLSPQ